MPDPEIRRPFCHFWVESCVTKENAINLRVEINFMEHEFVNDIEQLLEDCGSIIRQNRTNGQQYNIYERLANPQNETIHSAIIASLLNPNGRHGQGKLFLEKFLEVLQIDRGTFAPKNAIVLCEKSIGNIGKTDSGWTGGRIDIYLEDGVGHKIFIENKIEASDQDKQIARYHCYCDKAKIFYLTPNGHAPSSESTNGKSLKDLKCSLISYRREILLWLNKCISDNSVPTYLQETIRNYSNFLKMNLMNQHNEDLIKRLTKDTESVQTAIEIASNVKVIKVQAQKNFWTHLKEELSENGLNDAEYFSPDKGRIDEGKLEKIIKDYYSNDSPSDGKKFFGLRVRIGEGCYAALIVDHNLCYSIISDNAKRKTPLLESDFMKVRLKKDDWKPSKVDFRIAWRYPGGRYNFVDFSDNLVRECACSRIPRLSEILAEDFNKLINELRADIGKDKTLNELVRADA